MNMAESNFESLWNEFNNHYAPFEERGVDWDQQYGIYRPMVTPTTTDQEAYYKTKDHQPNMLSHCHAILPFPRMR